MVSHTLLLICLLLGIVTCIYTSVPYNIDEMQVILNGIDSSLAGMSTSKDCIFSVSLSEVEDELSRGISH